MTPLMKIAIIIMLVGMGAGCTALAAHPRSKTERRAERVRYTSARAFLATMAAIVLVDA